MKLPPFLRVLSHTLTVTESDPGNWSERGMARCNTAQLQIHLATKLPDAQKLSCLIHEAIHFGADQLQLSFAESEKDISGIETIVFSLLRDNPDFVSQFVEKAISYQSTVTVLYDAIAAWIQAHGRSPCRIKATASVVESLGELVFFGVNHLPYLKHASGNIPFCLEPKQPELFILE